jgi:hypothetical protein
MMMLLIGFFISVHLRALAPAPAHAEYLEALSNCDHCARRRMIDRYGPPMLGLRTVAQVSMRVPRFRMDRTLEA